MIRTVTDVAALVLNYNTPAMTIKCVNNLLTVSDELRIIVVDNHSPDCSLQEFHDQYNNNNRISIVENAYNGGYAQGNNTGIKYIRENLPNIRFVIILNPDIIIESEETILTLREELEKREEYAIASCNIILNNQPICIADFAWKFPDYKHLFWAGTFLGQFLIDNPNNIYESLAGQDNVAEVDVVSGCFFIAKLEELRKAGDFDERTFLYFEESILAKRLAQNNKQEIVVLTEQVKHNHQKKDTELKNIKKRAFDRRCFHDSKMIYIENYSDMRGILLALCKAINWFDITFKEIIWKGIG